MCHLKGRPNSPAAARIPENPEGSLECCSIQVKELKDSRRVGAAGGEGVDTRVLEDSSGNPAGSEAIIHQRIHPSIPKESGVR